MKIPRGVAEHVDLLAAGGVTLVFALAMAVTGPVRFAAGAAFILWVPGYALISLLFPRPGPTGAARESEHEALWSSAEERGAPPSPGERTVLAMAASLVATLFAGLIAWYADPRGDLRAAQWGLVLFSLVLLGAAFVRRRRPAMPSAPAGLPAKVPRSAQLAAAAGLALVILTVSASALLGWTDTRWTEFYLESPDGGTFDAGDVRGVGEVQALRAVVVHHERSASTYVVEVVRFDVNASTGEGDLAARSDPFVLERGGRHVYETTYPVDPGTLRVEVRLVRLEPDGEAHRVLEIRHGPVSSATRA